MMTTLQENLVKHLITLLIASSLFSTDAIANCNVAETYQTGTLNGKPYAFVDSNGDPYFMNSVNVRDVLYSNGSPRYTQSHFNQIASKGFNSVRLALNWYQFEQSNGNFNTASFNGLDQVIDRAEQAGLTVVLDPLHIKGDSYWNIPSWAWGNISPAQDLVWNEIVDHGLSYVQEFVSRYCNNSTVIAIDLVNEPREPNYEGDLDSKNEDLIDLYVDWITTLRQIDNNKIFLAEPFYGNAKIEQISLAPLASFSNIVWSFHDYFAGEGSDSDGFSGDGYATGNRCESWDGSGTYPQNSRTTARADMTSHVNVHLSVAHNLGIPMHIGEFGIPDKDGSEGWTGKTDFMCDKRMVYTSLDIPFTMWVWNRDIDNGFGIWHPNSGWLSHSDPLVDSNCGTFSNPNPNPDPDPNPNGCNLIQNADFNSGTQNWQTYINATASASLSANAGYADVTINNGSDNTWKVQLFQTGFQLEQGKTYEISFRAKADASKTIYVKLSNSTDNVQYEYQDKNITTAWTTQSLSYTMSNATDSNARLSFGIGSNNTDISIDDVLVKEQNCVEVLSACNEVENADFGAGQQPWQTYINATANASLNTNAGYADVTINNGSDNAWKVQLFQTGLSLEQGKTYNISFEARADANKAIYAKLSNSNDNVQYDYEDINVGTNWGSHSFTYTMSFASDNTARISFGVGVNATDIAFDNVIVEEQNCDSPTVVLGCMTACAPNYDPTATQDDGSCEDCPPPPTCRSNARLANPVNTAIQGAFAKFAQTTFTNNFIKAEKAYIKHQREIHRILNSKEKKYAKVNADFEAVKGIALNLLYTTFTKFSKSTTISSNDIQLLNGFLMSLSKATGNQSLKDQIENIQKYMHVMDGKEVKRALVDFDEAGEEDAKDTSETNQKIDEDFTATITNTFGREAYLNFQSNTKGVLQIDLFNLDGRKLNQSYEQTLEAGSYRHTISKQNLSKGIYYVQIYFKDRNGKVINSSLKMVVAE